MIDGHPIQLPHLGRQNYILLKDKIIKYKGIFNYLFKLKREAGKGSKLEERSSETPN